MHYPHISLGFYLLWAFFTCCLWSASLSAGGPARNPAVEGRTSPEHPPVALPQDARQLSTVEIREVFTDVRDAAEVRDSAGTRAVNYWYADGRFVNRWSNNGRSGEVTGQWRAYNNRRCVLILSGLPDRIGRETCAPVYQHGSTYLSINPDGSIHGVHTLSPIGAP